MPYSESDCYMLSALQHYAFCPRQCALIHKEQIWTDNYLTTKGDLFHERVDFYKRESRKDFHREFSLPIRSLILGLSGRTDIVEIYYLNGKIRQVIPIEYKSGKKKIDTLDEVQLCAQAICLEEMMKVKIANGYLYYGKDKRRHEVQLTAELRDETSDLASQLHSMMSRDSLPSPVFDKRCKACSLYDYCQPEIIAKRSISRYMKKALTDEDI